MTSKKHARDMSAVEFKAACADLDRGHAAKLEKAAFDFILSEENRQCGGPPKPQSKGIER